MENIATLRAVLHFAFSPSCPLCQCMYFLSFPDGRLIASVALCQSCFIWSASYTGVLVTVAQQ
uniref:Uncharacterized protein n=1 Tax=Anguilla anguilla TaxID=7936 RepID=A0A0E9U913_ANGAN